MVNKRQLIEPPPFTPLRFGLLPAAIDRTAEAPPHWEAGVTWQSHCPAGDGTYDPCLTVTRDPGDLLSVTTPDEPPPKEETTPFEPLEEAALFLRGATPFTVYTRLDCSPPGFWGRAQQLATQALTRVESFEVERVFDAGVAPTQGGAQETAYPHLRADAALEDDTGAVLQTVAEILTATPQDIVTAFGMLEDALADCYHGRGVLHVPAVLSAAAADRMLVTRSGEVMQTLIGHRVVFGSGYSGAAPDGAASSDVAWVYATGAVFYYRSDIRTFDLVDSFDRSNNTVEMLAERTYVIGWDCCHFAVPVDTGLTAAS